MLQGYRTKLYQDTQQEWHYYRERTHTVYHIPKGSQTLFQVYRQRLIVALAIGAVVYSFYPDTVWLSVFAAVLFYILTTTHFYKRLLPRFVSKRGVAIEEVSSLVQSEGGNPTTVAVVGVVGFILIVASFFIVSDAHNRAVLIAFSVGVIVSAGQRLS